SMSSPDWIVRTYAEKQEKSAYTSPKLFLYHAFLNSLSEEKTGNFSGAWDNLSFYAYGRCCTTVWRIAIIRFRNQVQSNIPSPPSGSVCDSIALLYLNILILI